MRLVIVAAWGLIACSSSGGREARVAPAPEAAGVRLPEQAVLDAAVATDVVDPVARALGPAVAGLARGVWDHGELVAENHVCALRDDRRVMCWGRNNHGEVGDDKATAHMVPVLVPGARDAVALAAGPSGTCAVIADGGVWCWGSFGPDAAPRRLADVEGAVEVAVTLLRRCARRRDGSVWCWTSYETPGAAAPIADLAGARRIVAGYDSVCAILTDGRVRCVLFPNPRSDGSSAPPLPPPVTIDVPDATGAIQLASHFQTTCGALADGTIRCWMLEDGRGQPTLQVATVAGVTDAIDLIAGQSTFCAARRAGGALCFSSGVPAGRSLSTTPADHLRRFRAIAVATSATCAVEPGGRRVCWGYHYGPLGRYGARTARPKPVAIRGVTHASELAVEEDSACVRRPGRRVTCWDEADAPRAVAGLTADRLVAGRRFTCAMTTGRQPVDCWGTRTWEDCIWESDDNCQFERLRTPTEVGGLVGLPGAVELADPCVILDSGQVACRTGQFQDVRSAVMPDVTHARSVSPRCAVDGVGAVTCWAEMSVDGAQAPLAVTTIVVPPAAEVVSGRLHSCARTMTGTVWCWGANRSGQLGDGTRRARTGPIEVAGLADVVQLGGGDRFTCARTRTGAVWCWGSNEDGALGDGSGRDQPRPVAVAGLSDAIELRVIGGHACVRRRGGTVACWGHHRGGDLGETDVDHALPVLEPDTLD